MLTSHLELPDEDHNWIVAVADPRDVRRLADAVGFWWEWDTAQEQFDHAARSTWRGDSRGTLSRLGQNFCTLQARKFRAPSPV